MANTGKSKHREKVLKLEELGLPNSKLKFCAEQLQNLNYLFHKKLQTYINETTENSFILAKSVTERLVQRLLCNVGEKDRRFSTKFLVSLTDHKPSHCNSNRLEYLVRLDALSSPPLKSTENKYVVIEKDSEYPPGYARIRMNTSTIKLWADFVNPSGYLRRDKVQAKLSELLAQAAAALNTDSPLEVDDSILCASPGKILDPVSVHHILQMPSEEQIFYGPRGNVPRFPDPRDFKIAIVDEPDGIKLRVEFLSPALANICINVRLLVAVGLDSWPSTTSFPSRIPLGHIDCLLYQKAAKTGMYLVGYGVQSSAWQIRVPAAEFTILNNYGSDSTVSTILDVLFDSLGEVNKMQFRTGKNNQLTYQILNRYIMQTCLLQELERDWENPSKIILQWSPLYLSTHVLQILDKLALHLKEERLPNYFFSNANLLVNPGHLCEDDFKWESQKIRALLLKLFDESLMSTKGNDDFQNMLVAQESEMMLLLKWNEILEGLLPPIRERNKKFCCKGNNMATCGTHTLYTSRQLEYIGLVLKTMLEVKQCVLQLPEIYPWEEGQIENNRVHENPIEDIVYLLVCLMEQGRDQFMSSSRSVKIKNKSKFKMQFEASTSKLVETIRKDKEMVNLDLLDDSNLVKVILKWLYKGMNHNKKTLKPILKPYLNSLFYTSHSVSWHLERIKSTVWFDELKALGTFARLINSGQITPAQGLVDAYHKNWIWAKEMLKSVEKGSLRIILTPKKGRTSRHILTLPTYSKSSPEHKNGNLEENSARTLPIRNYFNTILKQESGWSNVNDEYPPHEILKYNSPMAKILSNIHRRGNHRCGGDILHALLFIQKINVLKDVSSSLPTEERVKLLETIHKITNSRSKKSLTKRWSTSLPQLTKARIRAYDVQKYTPKEESAGIRLTDEENNIRESFKLKLLKKCDEFNPNSLIGSCREARIREDKSILNFHDNFRVKSLLRLKESFKQ